MADAFIFDHVRTPRGRGKPDGSLHGITPIQLAAQALQAVRDRNELDTALLDDIVLGCGSPIGEQGADIARGAALVANFDESVPGQVLTRVCASGREAGYQAAARGTSRPVEWRQADAMQLPFEDAVFDVVVCQFGVMFFPDKAKAFAETRRVLTPGGAFVFNVWDRIDENELADTVTTALASVFPDDPPRFMARTPHGYGDCDVICRDLLAGGFAAPVQLDTVTMRSVAPSARVAGVAFCQGTPLRAEIEARDPAGLEKATDAAAKAVAGRFGAGAVSAKMQAHVVTVTRD